MHACHHGVLPSLVIIPNQKEKQRLEYTKGRQKRKTKESQLQINMDVITESFLSWLSFQTKIKVKKGRQKRKPKERGARKEREKEGSGDRKEENGKKEKPRQEERATGIPREEEAWFLY